MNTFEIGEIALGTEAIVGHPECWNAECEIQSRPEYRTDLIDWDDESQAPPGIYYKVKWLSNGDISWQAPHELKKRPQPPDWNAIAYQKERCTT